MAPARPGTSGYILFVGTLDERKNVGGLLESYARLLSRINNVPRLVMAGGAGADAPKWLQAIASPPLAGHVDYRGYVPGDRREELFKGAQLFVLPSFEEGFGLPALEAMSAGVPVVVSNRGSLPEVVGDAGLLIDPDDPESLTNAIARMVSDEALRSSCAHRGLERAREFTWTSTANGVRRAYEDALLAKRDRPSSIVHRRSSMDERRATTADRRSQDDPRSTMDDRRSTMDRGRSTMDDRRSTIDDGRSTMDDRRSTMDDGRS
jgi:glycosyltransferase involved in cell wall biosynthesis